MCPGRALPALPSEGARFACALLKARCKARPEAHPLRSPGRGMCAAWRACLVPRFAPCLGLQGRLPVCGACASVAALRPAGRLDLGTAVPYDVALCCMPLAHVPFGRAIQACG